MIFGIFVFLIQKYIIKNNLSEKTLNENEIKKIQTHDLIFPGIATVGIVLSLIAPSYSYYVYLIGLVTLFRDRVQKNPVKQDLSKIND